MNTEGEDVTAQFKKGAALALAQIHEFQPDLVILQPRSPSCGKGIIYDGSFQNRLVEGDGMFARLLLDEGIPVMTCGEFLEEVKPLSTKGLEMHGKPMGKAIFLEKKRIKDCKWYQNGLK